MITENTQLFLEQAMLAESKHAAVPAAVFLVSPESFVVAEETTADNVYMDSKSPVDSGLALDQFNHLVDLVQSCGVEVKVFPGNPELTDGVFPNNVFATAPGRYVIGRMQYAGRRREAERPDIPAWLASQGREPHDLRRIDGVAELTGALIIDRARNIGFCGLSERLDPPGARAMHAAFGLDLSLIFELNGKEYHTNVVMSVLAGRAVVLQAEAFCDPQVPECIAQAFEGRALLLTEDEKNNFAGNCIALTDSDLFMSRRAEKSLRKSSRKTLESWGFTIRSVDLSEIEKAGGSLRCMVAEVF